MSEKPEHPVESSRLTPDDRIAEERRYRPRRVEDRVRIERLQGRYRALWKIALTAVSIWAIVATFGCVALYLQGRENARASRRALHAVSISDRALRQVRAQEVQLQDETAGACFRLNYLRWQVDRERLATWRRDERSAVFLEGIHDHATTALARFFAESAANTYFLPLTDCALADEHPTMYTPPGAEPFPLVSAKTLRRVFRHPPRPPAFR